MRIAGTRNEPRIHERTEAPKETRTWAQRDALQKRHAIRREVYVKVMVRDRLLTAFEAEQQYDSMWRRS